MHIRLICAPRLRNGYQQGRDPDSATALTTAQDRCCHPDGEQGADSHPSRYGSIRPHLLQVMDRGMLDVIDQKPSSAGVSLQALQPRR
jgi:hypothetical protein